MAITTYTELKAAVASWMHRDDLTSSIPDFITLAEVRINRELVTREHEIEVELAMTPGSRYVDLPAGMNYPVGLWLKAWLPRQKLQQAIPTELPVKTNVTGYPEYWAVDGAKIAFDKLASAAHTFDFRYVGGEVISDATPTNYVLTNYPDLYLFGACTEGATYIRDAAAAQMFDGRFQKALSDARNNENSARERAPLSTEIAASNRNARFNIIRGY